MASPIGFHSRWASFSGPYSHLVGVRASGWSKHFEECKLAAVEAQEIKENLIGVEASVGDLVGAEEFGEMAGAKKTCDFGPSLITLEMIDGLEKEGCIPVGKGRPPGGDNPQARCCRCGGFEGLLCLWPSLPGCAVSPGGFGRF